VKFVGFGSIDYAKNCGGTRDFAPPHNPLQGGEIVYPTMALN